MTRQKSFKRRVRARMEKTSESYSAARRQLLAKSASASEGSGTESPVPPQLPPDRQGEVQLTAASGTGVSGDRPSDLTIARRTGRDWEGWFALLDEWGATDRGHAEIAAWLAGQHGVTGWWAQSITVAYERARGLRAPGQGRDGSYSVGASKTVNVPVEDLFEAVADPQFRGRWLTGDLLEVTTATPSKSIRGRWGDTGSRVVIGFTPKGEVKSHIGVAHEKLSDPEAARRAKEYWAGCLKELKQLLESRAGTLERP